MNKYLKFHDVDEDQIVSWIKTVIKPETLTKSLNWWYGREKDKCFWYNATKHIALFEEEQYTYLAMLTFKTTTTTTFE